MEPSGGCTLIGDMNMGISWKYAFERGGPKRLEVILHTKGPLAGAEGQVSVSLDGEPLGPPVQGGTPARFALRDGSLLEVRVERRRYVRISAELNGRPLPDSYGDPVWQLRSGPFVMGILGGINGVAAILDYASPAPSPAGLLAVRLGIGSLIVGAGYAFAGIQMRRGRRAAAYAALVLVVLDALVCLVAFPLAGAKPLIVRGLVALTVGLGGCVSALIFIPRLKLLSTSSPERRRPGHER